MPARRYYLDASALVKLVISEVESEALRRHIAGNALLVSSRIAAVEVRRVAARQTERDATHQVDQLLESVAHVELDEQLATIAGAAKPETLRSLDAIHLASALSVRDELDAVISYDLRLADAARAAGLTVVAPA